MSYDAFLLLSFGGPEGPDDVLPFLENVTRGRGVPPERLLAVAEHYAHFGGVSPINDQCRELLAALTPHLDLPVYWGNRNWHPFLADTLRQMRADGVRRAVGFVTSAYGSYSACRQYREDIDRARAEVGEGAPEVDKLRHFHDHPGFLAPFVDGVKRVWTPDARLVFTAHSVPTAMDAVSGPGSWEAGPLDRGLRSAPSADGPAGGGRYTAQLREAAGLIADAVGAPEWDLVWQSRSGPPQVPWLEPDINDHLETLAKEGVPAVVAAPIGFVSDHLEVLWDLDNEAAGTADRLGLRWHRVPTPGADPRFVEMIVELVAERTDGAPRRRTGTVPVWDDCPVGCCPAPRRAAP